MPTSSPETGLGTDCCSVTTYFRSRARVSSTILVSTRACCSCLFIASFSVGAGRVPAIAMLGGSEGGVVSGGGSGLVSRVRGGSNLQVRLVIGVEGLFFRGVQVTAVGDVRR